MIRYFTLDDLETIYKLGEELSPNFRNTNNLEELLNNKFTKILVYERDNKVVAFLMYTELIDTVDILDIIVNKNYRNQHIATCLLDYMITELNNNIKLITLEVRSKNTPAINLYHKFYFEDVNIRKNYYIDDDAILMGRRINK